MSRALPVAFAAFPILLAWAVDVRPLLGILGTYSFFVGPKWAIVLTAAAAAALLLLFLPAPRARRDPAWLLWGAALVGFAVAPWLATDTPWLSGYLGTSMRRDGALTMIAALLLMAFAARAAQRDPRTLAWGTAGFVVAALGVGVVGALQAESIDVWGIPAIGIDPPRSTVGSHALTSLWTAMAVILALRAATAPRRSNAHRAALILAAAALAFATAAIGGRAALLALAGTIALHFVFLVGRARREPEVRPLLLAAVLLIPITAIGALRSDFAADRLERLGVVVDQGRAAAADAERLLFYRQALRALAEQPLRPYGVASFAFLAWRDLTPEQERFLLENRVHPLFASGPLRRIGFQVEFYVAEGEPRTASAVIDKAHNYVLDLLLAFGAWPTVALIALVALTLWRAWRSGVALAQGVAWAALLYAVAMQVWFSALALDPAVFALLGLAWGAATPGAAAGPPTRATRRRGVTAA